MANTNTNFEVGGGYSVDLSAFHDAVITHSIYACREKAFGESDEFSPEALEAYYNGINRAKKEARDLYINISNHPHSTWSQKQIEACGDAIIVDIPHPAVNPKANAYELDAATFNIGGWIISTLNLPTSQVHFVIAGAQGVVFRLVGQLKMEGYECLEACSMRNTVLNEDGSKTVKFDFVQFRSF